MFVRFKESCCTTFDSKEFGDGPEPSTCVDAAWAGCLIGDGSSGSTDLVDDMADDLWADVIHINTKMATGTGDIMLSRCCIMGVEVVGNSLHLTPRRLS